MGANFQTFTFADRPAHELRKLWTLLIESDRERNGSDAYSGGIATTDGLAICEQVMGNRTEAEDWIDERARKWGEAYAIRFETPKGELCWMVGALCAE